MSYNWINNTNQKLAGPQNNMLAPLQNMQPQKLRTGKNPNPRFPNARHGWENAKDRFGNVALGSLTGAGTGATIGSAFPGWGTAIGAGIGAVGGGFLGALSDPKGSTAFGTPESVEQYSQLDPQQQGIMQLLQQLGIYDLQNPYEGFEEGIANPAFDEFSQETVPNLAERFTSMGSNSLSSPAFQNRLASASAGLHSNLSAQKAQYGQQNKQQALQILMSLLQPKVENIHRPQSNGIVQDVAHGLVKAGPNMYKAYQKGQQYKKGKKEGE